MTAYSDTASDQAAPVAAGADVLVGTTDLRAALAAVLPHASADPETPELHQIVCDLSPDDLTFWATDALSAGMARAEVHAHQSPVLGRFAILPADAKKLLSIFKAGKESDDDPQYILQIEVTGEHVTVTDQSGLIPGRRYRVPQVYEPSAPGPQVDRLISRLHASPAAWADEHVFNGQVLARFKAATTAFREPVQVTAVSGARSLLVRCGSVFLGALMSLPESEEQAAERGRWRSGWDARLPAVNPREESE